MFSSSSPDDHGEPVLSKEARSTDCRPPSTKTASSPSRPLELANDLLEGAYHAKRKWTGEGDLADNARDRIRAEMDRAESWTAWRHAADKLDILEGNFLYKLDEESDECDMKLIRKRLDRLKHANHAGDINEMLLQIRHALKRDLGGMCNPHLYQHTHIGTKHLIEEYTEVVKYTIERITKYCETADEQFVDKCLEMMKAARQSFGNTALMLSGGGTLGMCHIGVVKALLETGVLPKIVCGSSAGSIVGSVLCTHRPDVIEEKLDELCSGDLRVFQGVDELQGIPGMAVNLLKGDPAFNVTNLCRVMKGLLGNITFREAYNFTGMVLNIHVSCRDKHNLPRLLNYVTAPNVIIWSAVVSSCALPCIFEAPGLKAKNPITAEIEHWGHADHKWIDGSIEGDLPAQTIERLFNINYTLAVQVNPHIIPLLLREGDNPGLLRKGLSATRANVIYMLDGLMEQGWDPFVVKMIRAILSQKYDGDVTILPNIDWVPFTQILANPGREFMARATLEGEKATWPKLDRIHKSVAIELALDRGIKAIRSFRFSKPTRTVSTTRSEKGLLHHRRSASGGPLKGLSIGTRYDRGRAAALHRPAQSVNNSRINVPTLAALRIRDHPMSSSDDTKSVGSSPTTEYDEDEQRPTDKDFIINPEDDEDEYDHEDRRRMPAFLSQPVSPHWGMDRSFASGPAASDMRRAMSGLQMSSVTQPPMTRRSRMP